MPETKEKTKESTPKIRLGAILTEEDTTRDEEGAYKLSMGRVMGWFMFAILIYMWIAAVTVPQSIIAVFLSIMAYNMGKKTTLFKDALDKKTGASDSLNKD